MRRVVYGHFFLEKFLFLKKNIDLFWAELFNQLLDSLPWLAPELAYSGSLIWPGPGATSRLHAQSQFCDFQFYCDSASCAREVYMRKHSIANTRLHIYLLIIDTAMQPMLRLTYLCQLMLRALISEHQWELQHILPRMIPSCGKSNLSLEIRYEYSHLPVKQLQECSEDLFIICWPSAGVSTEGRVQTSKCNRWRWDSWA